MIGTLNHAWDAKPSTFTEKDFHNYIEYLKSENNVRVKKFFVYFIRPLNFYKSVMRGEAKNQ
jgi:hypothetical protein